MAARDNDDHRIVRGVISPVAVIASGGVLLIPVLVGNATMETKDHLDARRIAQNCGGVPKSDGHIAGEVAGSAALSVITQGLQIGPAGEVAQNARR